MRGRRGCNGSKEWGEKRDFGNFSSKRHAKSLTRIGILLLSGMTRKGGEFATELRGLEFKTKTDVDTLRPKIGACPSKSGPLRAGHSGIERLRSRQFRAIDGAINEIACTGHVADPDDGVPDVKLELGGDLNRKIQRSLGHEGRDVAGMIAGIGGQNVQTARGRHRRSQGGNKARGGAAEIGALVHRAEAELGRAVEGETPP